jgi:peptidyl-prolyl cis-trans isomerase SurA
MQIINGADFEDLSKTHSDSPEASFGGDLGYFKKGRLLKEIDQEVFSLNVGDVSNIIRTPLGFHIFKVMDKKEGEIMAYEDVKHQLEEKLFSEQSDNAYKQWLKRLRDQAYVEIKM